MSLMGMYCLDNHFNRLKSEILKVVRSILILLEKNPIKDEILQTQEVQLFFTEMHGILDRLFESSETLFQYLFSREECSSVTSELETFLIMIIRIINLGIKIREIYDFLCERKQTLLLDFAFPGLKTNVSDFKDFLHYPEEYIRGSVLTIYNYK